MAIEMTKAEIEERCRESKKFRKLHFDKSPPVSKIMADLDRETNEQTAEMRKAVKSGDRKAALRAARRITRIQEKKYRLDKPFIEFMMIGAMQMELSGGPKLITGFYKNRSRPEGAERRRNNA